MVCAGSVCDHARILERSQEPDENIHGLVCFEKACNVNSPQIQVPKPAETNNLLAVISLVSQKVKLLFGKSSIAALLIQLLYCLSLSQVYTRVALCTRHNTH